MDHSTNQKILVWLAVIFVLLFIGLQTEIASPLKYGLVAATFLIAVGVFLAIQDKKK